MPTARYAILVMVLLSGCTISNLELTHLQQRPPYLIEVHALSNWRHIERTARNAVQLAPGALVGMRVPDLTDGLTSAEYIVPAADGMTMYLGTTPYDLQEKADSGHVLRVGTTSSTLTTSDGMVYKIAAGLPAGEPTIIGVENNGRKMRVVVGCADTLVLSLRRPTTEWTIIAAAGGCTINDPELDILYPRFVNLEQQSVK
jgi:hypothetical protein